MTLSTRETQVLRAYADGQCIKTASRTVGISANTIKDRLRTARLKLGARTTVQAVASAIRMGLL